MMNRQHKIIDIILPLLIISLCAVGMSAFLLIQKEACPDNPLNSTADFTYPTEPSNNYYLPADLSETDTDQRSYTVDTAETNETQNIAEKSEDSYTGNDDLTSESNPDISLSETPDPFEPSPSVPGNNEEISGTETDRIYFTTTIKDNEIVSQKDYFFEIIHHESDLSVRSQTVYINGVIQPQFKGRVPLETGRNIIRVSVEYADINGEIISVYKDYSVYLDTGNIFIVTDMYDRTVSKKVFTFRAHIVNGSDHARLTVVVNGKTVTGSDTYTVDLNIGNNVIRLKATDKIGTDDVKYEMRFVVKYVPETTEKTSPKILYINVRDGMNIRGSEFTLDILPVDYQGKRIYYDGISVFINGTLCGYNWDSEFTSYLLSLRNGENLLEIRVTDCNGYYADYSYKINCTEASDGELIGEITLSIDANVLGIGEILSPVNLNIYQGESAAHCIARALEGNGFEYEYGGSFDDGFYLTRIKKNGIGINPSIPRELIDYINEDELEWKEQRFDDSIGDFDYCQGSGWMYSINGKFTNFSLSDAVFKDGDIIRVRYTLAYGKDIGGYYGTGETGGKNYDKTW